MAPLTFNQQRTGYVMPGTAPFHVLLAVTVALFGAPVSSASHHGEVAEPATAVGSPSAATPAELTTAPIPESTMAPRPESSLQAPPQDPEKLLEATAAAYEVMHAFRADFEQVLRNDLLGRTTRSTGTLYQREPDKFLMAFTDPGGDVIVSDGRYFWMYFPSVDEQQVLRTPRRSQGLDLHAQFIGDVNARFDAVYHGTEEVLGRTAHVLTLNPTEAVGYRRLKVWIDDVDHLVRRFELTEESGNVRHMLLRDLTVNPELPDDLFEFQPPDGTFVVDRG